MYAALLADVKASKKYARNKRFSLQMNIDSALRCLNNMYHEVIIRKVDFSGGDEIQGLFDDPLSAYWYYRLLSLVLGVGVFRCGIGVGSWDVELSDREESAAQDGEAYHLARRAIEESRKGDYYDLVCRSYESGDNSLTIFLDHSWGECKLRTDPQNEVALVAELMYPLVLSSRNWSIDPQEWARNAEELLYLYVCLREDEGKVCKLAQGLLGRRCCKLPVKPTVIDGREDLTSGRHESLYGAAREIADIAGVTHQGVGRKIAQGRLIQERNAIAYLGSV